MSTPTNEELQQALEVVNAAFEAQKTAGITAASICRRTVPADTTLGKYQTQISMVRSCIQNGLAKTYLTAAIAYARAAELVEAGGVG